MHQGNVSESWVSVTAPRPSYATYDDLGGGDFAPVRPERGDSGIDDFYTGRSPVVVVPDNGDGRRASNGRGTALVSDYRESGIGSRWGNPKARQSPPGIGSADNLAGSMSMSSSPSAASLGASGSNISLPASGSSTRKRHLPRGSPRGAAVGSPAANGNRPASPESSLPVLNTQLTSEAADRIRQRILHSSASRSGDLERVASDDSAAGSDGDSDHDPATTKGSVGDAAASAADSGGAGEEGEEGESDDGANPAAATASTTASAPALRPRSSIDDYQSVKQIGEGSFGSVLLARNVHDGKMYAIKQCHLRGDAKTNKMKKDLILKEIRLTAKSCKHPNIIDYREAMYRNGVVYMVLEYADAGTLRDRLLSEGGNELWREDKVLRFFVQVWQPPPPPVARC